MTRRSQGEIRDEIARCEAALQKTTSKTAMVVLGTRIDALKWAASRAYKSVMEP